MELRIGHHKKLNLLNPEFAAYGEINDMISRNVSLIRNRFMFPYEINYNEAKLISFKIARAIVLLNKINYTQFNPIIKEYIGYIDDLNIKNIENINEIEDINDIKDNEILERIRKDVNDVILDILDILIEIYKLHDMPEEVMKDLSTQLNWKHVMWFYCEYRKLRKTLLEDKNINWEKIINDELNANLQQDIDYSRLPFVVVFDPSLSFSQIFVKVVIEAYKNHFKHFKEKIEFEYDVYEGAFKSLTMTRKETLTQDDINIIREEFRAFFNDESIPAVIKEHFANVLYNSSAYNTNEINLLIPPMVLKYTVLSSYGGDVSTLLKSKINKEIDLWVSKINLTEKEKDVFLSLFYMTNIEYEDPSLDLDIRMDYAKQHYYDVDKDVSFKYSNLTIVTNDYDDSLNNVITMLIDNNDVNTGTFRKILNIILNSYIANNIDIVINEKTFKKIFDELVTPYSNIASNLADVSVDKLINDNYKSNPVALEKTFTLLSSLNTRFNYSNTYTYIASLKNKIVEQLKPC